jgi:hypothetical protein
MRIFGTDLEETETGTDRANPEATEAVMRLMQKRVLGYLQERLSDP